MSLEPDPAPNPGPAQNPAPAMDLSVVLPQGGNDIDALFLPLAIQFKKFKEGIIVNKQFVIFILRWRRPGDQWRRPL